MLRLSLRSGGNLMDLILWRHAEAKDGLPDMERELTDKGHRQAKNMAAFLAQRLPENTRILVSPARRTLQTARALTDDFTVFPSIAPDASAPEVLRTLLNHDFPSVLLVGHQPWIGELAACLLAGGSKPWSFKKGAVWWFRFRGSQANLRLSITPGELSLKEKKHV